MGLMDKVSKKAGKKALEKVLSAGLVDNAINTILTTHNSKVGIKTTEEIMQKAISKNQLVIKCRSFSLGSVVDAFSGKFNESDGAPKSYQIYDCNGELVYKCDPQKTVFDRSILNLYDADDEYIGTITEPLVNMSVSLVEKNVKKCTVHFGSTKICELKKSVERLSNVRYIETLNGDVKVDCNEHNQFTVTYNGRLIARLYPVTCILKDGYVDKYVMKYDYLEDEMIGVLLAIVVDIII